jgi:Uma2 family endonuclease
LSGGAHPRPLGSPQNFEYSSPRFLSRDNEEMAAATTPLTLEQFHALYENESGYEYWYGEAVHKGVATTLHGLTQVIIGGLLRKLGYHVGTEIDLRIDPRWEPRPDVLVSLFPLPQPYPNKPDNLFIFEVLSPDDALPKLFRKCRNYLRIGVEPVFVIDPEARDSWEWSRATNNLERVSHFALPGDKVLAVDDVWSELDPALRG